MFGAVCGVVVGCTIGAMVGLATADVAQREREQRDQEIATILIELMRSHNRDWRLFLPTETLVLDDDDANEDGDTTDSKKIQHRHHHFDHQHGVGHLRPISDDRLAQDCLFNKQSSVHQNETMYIPIGGWAVLRCRPEDQTEANLLARHMSIVFHTLLHSKS